MLVIGRSGAMRPSSQRAGATSRTERFLYFVVALAATAPILMRAHVAFPRPAAIAYPDTADRRRRCFGPRGVVGAPLVTYLTRPHCHGNVSRPITLMSNMLSHKDLQHRSWMTIIIHELPTQAAL